MDDHSKWMQEALKEAEKALAKNEVPVGAVVVCDEKIVGRGHNLIETLQDPAAHAEMLAITAASNTLASWRLDDCVLYATLEPCLMCAGAILLSRIPLVVFAAEDPRLGACGSVVNVLENEKIDLQAKMIKGVLEEPCSKILKDFFKKLRQ